MTTRHRPHAYIVRLGANSVALPFPIYTNGVHPTEVYGVSGSIPSPATLDLVIKAAQARGLGQSQEF